MADANSYIFQPIDHVTVQPWHVRYAITRMRSQAGTGTSFDSGDYTIFLTGFTSVPEPSLTYFTSGRDGRLCLWGQRIDEVTHRPVGQAFAAHHFDDRPVFQQLGWSLARGRAAMALMKSTGNIWMMSRPGNH